MAKPSHCEPLLTSCPCSSPSSVVLWVLVSAGDAVFLKRCSVDGSRIFFKAAGIGSAGSDA